MNPHPQPGPKTKDLVGQTAFIHVVELDERSVIPQAWVHLYTLLGKDNGWHNFDEPARVMFDDPAEAIIRELAIGQYGVGTFLKGVADTGEEFLRIDWNRGTGTADAVALTVGNIILRERAA